MAGLAAKLDLLPIEAGDSLPVLLTDLVVDPYQLYEARVLGGGRGAAGGCRVRGRPRRARRAVRVAALDVGLDVVVEVAQEDEIEHVLELLDPDSFLIRNHRTTHGHVDFERTFSLLEEVPAGKVVLSQGGVREP